MTAWFSVIMPLLAIATLHAAVFGPRETLMVAGLFVVWITATGILWRISEWFI